jgi:hypothetical protein
MQRSYFLKGVASRGVQATRGPYPTFDEALMGARLLRDQGVVSVSITDQHGYLILPAGEVRARLTQLATLSRPRPATPQLLVATALLYGDQ